MKKKISVLLMVMLVLSLTACGKKDIKNEQQGEVTEENLMNSKVISTDEILSVYDFNIEDYVELGDYKNFKMDITTDTDITDEKVVEYIDSMLSYNSEYKKIDKTDVNQGDIVNINYVGKIDGEEFDGGSAEDAHLEIGSNQYIEGFESGLVGHKVGETVSLNLKFPEDYYYEEYKGKDVVFDVTINYIEEQDAITYETATEEYVKTNYGYDSKNAWFDATKASLRDSASQQQFAEVQYAFLDKLKETSKVTVPDSLLQDELNETVRQAEVYAKNNLDGLSLDEYLAQYEGCNSVDEYKEKITEELTENLKEQLLVDAIIKKENKTITEGGYTDFLTYYLDSYGMEEKEFYEAYGSKETMQLIYAENMILGEIVDNIIENK